MSTSTQLAERCSCGATFQVTSYLSSNVKEFVDEWRENHKHETPPERKEENG